MIYLKFVKYSDEKLDCSQHVKQRYGPWGEKKVVNNKE